ncbi:MAG: DegT/DnrJ/EryC1/StrS family aminotransferase [Rhodothermales bacterium]
MKVDFYQHRLRRSDADSIADVLATPFLTTGKVGAGVEAQLVDYFGVPYALLFNSWTNGAFALMLALDLKPGDEVIVPAMTFIASANIVELTGAKIVLVDVDPDTFLLSPDAVAQAVTPNTRVVIPVHLYGQMVDVAGMRHAIDRASAPGQKVYLVEDCAHCFEGQRDGYRPGKHSDAAVFSFYATKNVTCGEGGAVILKDAELQQRLRETRLHGMSAIAADRFSGGRYNHWDMNRLGTKGNLPDILAALLPRQIENIDEFLPVREAVARRYLDAIADIAIETPARIQGCVHAWHLFAIGVPAKKRDQCIDVLNGAGVPVTVNYRALPDLTYYGSQYPESLSACPIAVQWGRKTLTLPFYPNMPQDQQDHIIDVLRKKVAPLLCAW